MNPGAATPRFPSTAWSELVRRGQERGTVTQEGLVEVLDLPVDTLDADLAWIRGELTEQGITLDESVELMSLSDLGVVPGATGEDATEGSPVFEGLGGVSEAEPSDDHDDEPDDDFESGVEVDPEAEADARASAVLADPLGGIDLATDEPDDVARRRLHLVRPSRGHSVDRGGSADPVRVYLKEI